MIEIKIGERILRVPKIYFDLDGVCANFEKMAAQTLGVPYWNPHDDTHWEIWDKIPHLFYTLEPLDDGIRLFNYVVNRVGMEHVEFLTAVPDPTGLLYTAPADKEQWVHRHVNDQVIVNTVQGGKNKIRWLVDNPGAVLIDDYDRNIKLWNEHGGIGIKHVDFESSVAKLRIVGIV